MAAPVLTFTPLNGPTETSAPTLMVGPSLGTSVAALWSPVAELLDGSVHVLGWDLPGHGNSPSATEPFSIEDLAETVGDRVSHTGESAAYAGVSVGGAVGLALAAAAAPVEPIVVIASAPVIGTPEGWAERARLVRAEGTASLVAASSQRWFAAGFTRAHPDRADRLLGSLYETDAESYALVCEALGAFDLSDRLAGNRRPLLLTPGEVDPVVTVDEVRRFAAAIGGSRVEVLTGCAHLPTAEDPRQTAAAITGFLQEGGS